MKRGKITPASAEPVDMTFITEEYVNKLLRGYGYERRFYGLYGNDQLASAETDQYEGKNPLKRVLYVNRLHRDRNTNLLYERITGMSLGKIAMLRQILDLLGHTAQAEQIEENADDDIENEDPEQLLIALELNEYMQFTDELKDMH